MRRLILIIMVFTFSNSAEAIGWTIQGGSYWLNLIGGVDGNSNAKARILILNATSSLAGESENQICYLTDLVNPQQITTNYSKQESVLYCERTVGSSLSGVLFLQNQKRSDKAFECVKNCRAKAPKILRFVTDAPD